MEQRVDIRVIQVLLGHKRLETTSILEELLRAHQAGQLQFFGEHTALADASAFVQWLATLRQ